MSGRVAIVTGGAFNIGRAVAEHLAGAGMRVTIAARDRARIESTVAAIEDRGGTALGVPTDVRDLAQVEAMVSRTVERFGGVHLLAAFAGGGGAEQPIDAVDPAAWSDVVDRNLVGTFHCARAVVPEMRASGLPCSILTCAGGGAFFPMMGTNATAYACSKAAICRFTDQLQAELLDTAIRVNCIEPGAVPPGDRAAADRVAALVGFLYSDAATGLRGRVVSVSDTWWRDPGAREAVAASETACRLRREPPPENDLQGLAHLRQKSTHEAVRSGAGIADRGSWTGCITRRGW